MVCCCPLFPGLPTLYVSALLLGSTFHFFFITVQGIAGGIGGSENRARNFALIGMGFSAAGFIGPFLAGVTIDHLGHLSAFLALAAFPVVPGVHAVVEAGLPAESTQAGQYRHHAERARLVANWRISVMLVAAGVLMRKARISEVPGS